MKKFLAALVFLAMTVTVVGCDKNKTDDVTQSSTAGAGNTEMTSDNTTDETSEVTIEQETEESTAAPTEEPTEAPITEEQTEAPTTEAPTTEAPTTEAPTTEAPTTEAPTTEAPTEEQKYFRDATYTLSFVSSDGKTIECVIEYDSSEIAFELVDNDIFVSAGRDIPIEIYDKVTYMHPFNEAELQPWESNYAYPVIKTGCTSYEKYKEYLIEKFKSYGDSAPRISELSTDTVNGYTYHFLEGIYRGDTIGDPDIVYVQIGDNEYIEMYSVQIVDYMEDFINTCFYIKEVTIK